MPWDALPSSVSLCFAIALGFFLISASYMYDWRVNEVSYAIKLPFVSLEGTAQDVEPKIPPIGDVAVATWIIVAMFAAMSLVMGMWCARLASMP